MMPEEQSTPMMEEVNGDEPQLTSDQVRAARALLQWDQRKLAAKSNVSLATIKRLEPIPGPIKANRVTVAAIKGCLQEAGIVFIDGNGGGVGVRLRNP